ncbi:MAG: hypothetical protein LBR31_05680 [Desulfovibrio sp.]|nr:hypothetical protein [Desulfovibrio sp.]
MAFAFTDAPACRGISENLGSQAAGRPLIERDEPMKARMRCAGMPGREAEGAEVGSGASVAAQARRNSGRNNFNWWLDFVGALHTAESGRNAEGFLIGPGEFPRVFCVGNGVGKEKAYGLFFRKPLILLARQAGAGHIGNAVELILVFCLKYCLVGKHE